MHEPVRGHSGTLAQPRGVSWFGEANPPEHGLLVEEASRLAAVLGTELDLSVTAT